MNAQIALWLTIWFIANGAGHANGSDRLQFFPGGSRQCDQPVLVSLLHSSGCVRYTLDNSEPSENSYKYLGPILITNNCVIRGCVLYTNGKLGREFSQTYLFVRRKVTDDNCAGATSATYEGLCNTSLHKWIAHNVKAFRVFRNHSVNRVWSRTHGYAKHGVYSSHIASHSW
jgi:Fn3 associated